jgi:hypothetical protein
MDIKISMTHDEANLHIAQLAEAECEPVAKAKLVAVKRAIEDLMERADRGLTKAAMLEQCEPPRHVKERCGSNKCPRCNYDHYATELAS